jgi:hypothetical protein
VSGVVSPGSPIGAGPGGTLVFPTEVTQLGVVSDLDTPAGSIVPQVTRDEFGETTVDYTEATSPRPRFFGQGPAGSIITLLARREGEELREIGRAHVRRDGLWLLVPAMALEEGAYEVVAVSDARPDDPTVLYSLGFDRFDPLLIPGRPGHVAQM